MYGFEIQTSFSICLKLTVRHNVTQLLQLREKAHNHTLSCGSLCGGILTEICIDSFTGMPRKIIISLMLAL